MFYTYGALQKYNIKPSEFLEMDTKEQAIIIAFIDFETEQDKKHKMSL